MSNIDSREHKLDKVESMKSQLGEHEHERARKQLVKDKIYLANLQRAMHLMEHRLAQYEFHNDLYLVRKRVHGTYMKGETGEARIQKAVEDLKDTDSVYGKLSELLRRE